MARCCSASPIAGVIAIVTTAPNELCAELHDRMPVVLKPDVWPAWLGEEPAGAPAQSVARALLGGGNDLLAGERARRQRQEQRPEPDRADCSRCICIGGLPRCS
jgi:putative SOS response-associated peptidase YedK